MNHLCLALAFGATFLVRQGPDQAHRSTVDRALLEAAVHAGRGSEVEPYLLRQSADGKSIVGRVYTPFVRIGRYVWNAQQQGRTVGVDDLPYEVISPVLHVVMPQPATEHSLESTRMAAIYRPSTSPPAGKSVYFMPFGNRMPPPIAMTTLQSLEAMVGKMSDVRPSLAGVFPASVAQQDVLEFCVYQREEAGSYHVVSGYVAGPLR